MLGHLTPNQCTTCRAATCGDTGDHLFGRQRVEGANGHVVQKEQRLCAHADQVVDAHRNEVDADRIQPTELTGDLDLGTDTVGRGHQHGMSILRHVQGE